MSSFVTFWILVGTVLLIGALFFQVVKPLVLPLFMGAVLAILFRPLFIRCVRLCRGRMRQAAALSTAAVVVIAVGPLLFVGEVAIRQGSEYLSERFPRPVATEPAVAGTLAACLRVRHRRDRQAARSLAPPRRRPPE